MTPWLSIVGIGEDGLDACSPVARTLIETAEVLVGGERHLAMVPETGAERLTWRRPLTETVDDIAKRAGKRVVVVATGDPMSYGIGVTLARHFDRAELTILPAPSAFSLACALLGWPLEETVRLTLHGRPLELLNLHVVPGARLLVLSEGPDTPAQVAAVLRARGFGPSTLTVLEHMGGPAEARRDGTAATWDDAPTAPLNTIAVTCVAGDGARIHPRTGLPDDAFVSDGQLTKRVVRAATLATLVPLSDQLLWDIGAGCGSVAIEWLRAAPQGRAHAVERAPGRCAMMANNASALGTPTLDIVVGEATSAIPNLDPPDAVFIGGGIATDELVDQCWHALKPGGRLVANVVTVAGEAAVLQHQKALGGALTRIAVSNAEPVGSQLGWRPAMPVTQWSVTK